MGKGGAMDLLQVSILSLGLFLLATISGMVGLGVAFAAIPFLGIFLPDLVNQVQPLSLLLNGVTALFATVGFATSGYMDWKKAFTLAVVTTLMAPVGAILVYYVKHTYIWYIYLAAVIFLSYRLFRPVRERRGKENFSLALALAVPISVLSGFLGVGPGFLLMPSLILVGFEAKLAAGINAFAVTWPSFSALVPHIASANLDWRLTAVLVVVGAGGAFLGAKITSRYVPGPRLRQIFGLLIVIMTAYKIYTLLR
jgi:uncharacterized membrane protein YfcA